MRRADRAKNTEPQHLWLHRLGIFFLTGSVAVMLTTPGCIPIPAGEDVLTSTEIGRETIRSGKLVSAELKPQVQASSASPDLKVAIVGTYDETAFDRVTQNRNIRDKTVVIGLYPGHGAYIYVGRGSEWSANWDAPSPKPVSAVVINVVLLGFPSVIPWFTEFEREWTPPPTVGEMNVQISLIGWCKTGEILANQKRIFDEPSKSQTVSKKIPDVRVTLLDPDTGLSVTASTDHGGDATLPTGELPFHTSEPLTFSVSASGVDVPIATRQVRLPGHTVGWNLPVSLWADLGAYRYEKIYADTGPIDFSKGRPQAAPRVRVRVAVQDQSKDKPHVLPIRVTVTNVGRGAVYRLIGKTVSDEKCLSDHLLVFGKVKPSETVTRDIEFPLSLLTWNKTSAVSVQFKELNLNAPAEVSFSVNPEALRRPALAWTYEIIDDEKRSEKVVGNADGVLQRGESVDVVFTVKNTGTAVAQSVKLNADLPKDKSIEVYGNTTMDMGTIPVGSVAQAKLNVQVKAQTQLKKLPIQITLSEAGFKLSKQADTAVVFDTRLARRPITVDRKMWVSTADSVLRYGASDDAKEHARAPKDAMLHVVGELPGWLQVEMTVSEQGKRAKRRLWAKAAELTSRKPQGAAAPGIVVTRWGNTPPSITFVTPQTSLSTADDRAKVVVSVVDANGTLEKVRMLAGPDTKNVRGVKIAKISEVPKAAGGDSRVLEHLLRLEYGPNIVRVEAEDNEGATTTRTLTITRRRKVGTTYLLAVGINAYAEKKYQLSCARQDAEKFAVFARKQLGADGGDVTLLLDKAATSKGIRVAFGSLRAKVRKEDTVLVFLAGHGLKDKEGDGYFLTADSEVEKLFGTAIGMDEFSRLLGKVRSDRLLVIADVCHSKNITLPAARGSRVASELFGALLGKGTLLIGYDGQGREDTKRGHGYLTAFLLEGLAGPGDLDKDGRITVRELKEYAAKKVNIPGGGKVWIKGEGDMTFVKVPQR